MQEKQMQQLHESVIGFQERCRQMTEIVRAKKLQKQQALLGNVTVNLRKDGTGSLAVLNNNQS